MKTTELSNGKRATTRVAPTCFAALALAFLACAGLQAQVTIGGLANPKGGAILDLNSDVKGGLVLSNVSLTDPGNIPSDFPGVASANEAAVKAGMKGSMIYNTNANTCIGVHVWNGNYWERPAMKAPVKGAITLTMLSDLNTLFGGSAIEFEATPGGRIYRWYASVNNGPYEFVALTTTHTLSKAFPAGSLKVQVIMDDCQSQKESNYVAFTPDAVSPAFGSLDGGNIIYIYGDFPYAATSEYAAPANLVAHFDGINNRGLGDKQHSFDPMASWKDLKSTFDLPRNSTATGKWLSNGFLVENDNAAFYNAFFPANFPAGTQERTVEVIFRTPETQEDMFEQELEVQRRIFFYGEYSSLHNFGVIYRGYRAADIYSIPDACGDYGWVFYAIFGFNNNLVTCLSSTPSLITPNTINTVTSTYKNRISDAQYTNSYINNTPAVVLLRSGGGILNTLPGTVSIGEKLAHSTFLSVRLYDRVLDSKEIAKNAALDQIRYLNPPTVAIGGKACTEVVVLSKNILMCRVPEGDAVGNNIGVTLNGAPYSQYKYVDPTTDFYISSISPIAGPANTSATLTLEGNLLNTITRVEVEGTACPYITPQGGEDESKIRRYTLPAHAAGEVDIIVTAGGKAYRFAKVFEYEN